MAVLFVIGASCFTVGAIVTQWSSVSRPAIGYVFFVGSIFFTTASLLQYIEMSRAPRAVPELQAQDEQREDRIERQVRRRGQQQGDIHADDHEAERVRERGAHVPPSGEAVEAYAERKAAEAAEQRRRTGPEVQRARVIDPIAPG